LIDIGGAFPYPLLVSGSSALNARPAWPVFFPVVALILALVWLAAPCPAAEPPAAAPAPPFEASKDYPSVIPPLPKDELAALRAQFARENPAVCTELNAYGFTTAKPACPERESRAGITDEDAAMKGVSAWLTAHARFTGFAGRSRVKLKNLTEIRGCAACTPPDPENIITELQLYFPRQLLLDLPVEGDVSPLIVFADAKGVFRVEGYWLPESPLPLRTTISSAAARHTLVGTPVSPGAVKGKGTAQPHVITDRDLRHVSRRVVFVNESSRGLEVRVAWRIPIGATMPWTAYVDAITGEVLRIILTPKQEPGGNG
jgi:hypothetical protein